VDMEKKEVAGGTQVIGWNLAAMLQEDKEQAEKLWRERARGRGFLGAESTGDNIESEAEWCQEALGKVLDATAKKIRIWAWSNRWWNGDIQERRSHLGKEKRRRRRSAARAQAKAELQKSVWRAKDRMWNDYLKNLREAEVWRAARFANLQAGVTVEALTDRYGIHVNTITEKGEILRQVSFPLHKHDRYCELPQGRQVHQSVTEQAVNHALFMQSIRKAPGPDKLSFRTVCPLWEWEKMRIVELAKAVVQGGRNPAVWKQASSGVIRKPGKDNYTKLKVYHSISLLSCMGKVVEKVVAELLAEEAERR